MHVIVCDGKPRAFTQSPRPLDIHRDESPDQLTLECVVMMVDLAGIESKNAAMGLRRNIGGYMYAGEVLMTHASYS